MKLGVYSHERSRVSVWWLAASYKYNSHILIVFISSLERSNVVGIYNVGLYFSIGVYYDVASAASS